MYEQGLRLMSVLSEIGGGKMDTFADRMFNQKAVFILSRLGIQGLDYPFNWYVRGPYSPELTFQLYESQGILDQLEHDGTPKAIFGPDTKPLEAFHSMIEELKLINPDTEFEIRLELVASIIYLAEQLPTGTDKRAKIREALPRLKEHFKGWDIDRYLAIVSKYHEL